MDLAGERLQSRRFAGIIRTMAADGAVPSEMFRLI